MSNTKDQQRQRSNFCECKEPSVPCGTYWICQKCNKELNILRLKKSDTGDNVSLVI